MKYLSLIKKIVLTVITVSCWACFESKSEPKFKISDKFSLLWEITGNNLSKPSYLYGTIHIYDTTVYKLPKEVFEAIDLCDNFALELDLNNLKPETMMKHLVIPYEDSTLNLILNPEAYSALMRVPIIKLMGENVVNRMKPTFLVIFTMVDSPADIKAVDAVLNSYATDQKKNIFGIETMEEQLNAMDKISLREQAQAFHEMYEYCKKENLEFLEAGKKILSILSEAYKNQDFEISKQLEKDFKVTSNSSSAFDSAMLKDRNIKMADRISDYIKSDKTLFTGVGMLHLPDSDEIKGVVTLLKEKGYTLRPILIDLKK